MAIVRAYERASGKDLGLGKDMACALRQVRLSSSLQHRGRDSRGLPLHREEDTGRPSLEALHHRQVCEIVAVQYPVPMVAPLTVALLMAALGVILDPKITPLQPCNTEDPAHGLVGCLLHPLVTLQLTAVITVAPQALCFKNVKSVPESDPGRGPKSAGLGLWLTTLDNIHALHTHGDA